MSDLLRRHDALENTRAKYLRSVFDWKKKQTCAHMARHHLRAMGHRPPSIPRMQSPIGARTALKKNGWLDCADMLDALHLPRIAPAMMLPGDLILAHEEEGLGFGAICVFVGKKFMGYRLNLDDDGQEAIICSDLIITQVLGAWRL